MSILHIPTNTPYDVHIASGILPQLGAHLVSMTKACTVAVISDDTVFPLYGKTVCDSLTEHGFRVVSYVIPSGESSKNITHYINILNFLVQEHLTRGDLLCALGGGVVGDLTGFAAATYLRGIPYVQIPTTLLAAVDSSVGGKTAIDLAVGKNMVGAFWQPLLVWCDLDTLSTLPPAVFRDGCGEVIKYGLLGDAAFFHQLAHTPMTEQLEAVVDRCVAMKRDIVIQDERDHGLRQTLNLGHTFAHAIEAVSGYSLLHGHCVAIGMAMITRAAAQKGLCSEETASAVEALLQRYELPTRSPYGLEPLAAAVQADKKIFGASIHLVVPEAIGQCRLLTIPAAELRSWLQAGGAQ